MSDNMVYSQMKEKAENVDPIGGTLKFIVDKSIVHIDGTGGSNVISEEDKDADCTISTSLEVLLKLKNGEVNPRMAVMGGQIKISGDMGLAMKVQSLLS